MGPAERGAGLLRPIDLLWAQMAKKRGEYRTYWFDFGLGLAIKAIFLLGALQLVRDVGPRERLAQVAAFGVWYLSAHLLSKLGNMVDEEAYVGTLGQLLTSQTPFGAFVVSLAMAEALASLVWVGAFVLTAGLVLRGEALEILASLSATDLGRVGASALAGLAGMFGVALAVGGLSFRFKRVGSLVEVLNFYLLIFSGFFVPAAELPTWARAANLASPLWWAHEAMGGDLAAFAATAAAAVGWLALGAVTMTRMLAWARAAGRLTTRI